MDKVIASHREALALCPVGHMDRLSALNSLAIALRSRYQQSGSKEDLDEMIIYDREALNLCPLGHLNRSMSLITLGSAVLSRYERSGSMEDLEEVIKCNHEALTLCPPGHPHQAQVILVLANIFLVRYERLGTMADLEESIIYNREVLTLCPPGHPDRPTSLFQLGKAVCLRYKALGRIQDLEEAITYSHEATLCVGHPDYPSCLDKYRKLANDLLRKCRALPLKGFQRLDDLNIEQLILAVNKATHYEHAWRRRSPRPIPYGSYNNNGIHSHSHYMDVSPKGKLAETIKQESRKWYKIISAPPGEKVDWLSPVTSSYTLCATKSGKVVCWDVQSDTCLAEWNPGARWELWKCRVEFEERAVFFTMAKVLAGSYDDDRIMEFVLMRLTFSDAPSGESSPNPPTFSHVTEFRTTGVVMNVFLDPSERVLSAFIWVSTSNTIGFYVLPDWDKKEYVFIDTGIECVMSSNWSCILFQQHIVIHCEESDVVSQHFYPLSLLRQYLTVLTPESSTSVISRRLTPFRTLTKRFRFPPLPNTDRLEPDLDDDNIINPSIPILNLYGAGPSNQAHTTPPSSSASPSAISTVSSSGATPSSSSVLVAPPTIPSININPHPFPPWYPESAHFVRQWWPTLPNIPRVSCTVALLAEHDPRTHRTRFVLAQHYFCTPLDHAEWDNPSLETSTDLSSSSGGEMKMSVQKLNHLEDVQDDALMRLWYVSKLFEVVRVSDAPGTIDDEDNLPERPRPLIAVDFGHAVWIEYNDVTTVEHENPRRLRFVTFPPFSEEYEAEVERPPGRSTYNYEGEVRTLEIPSELDLGTVETINIDQSQGAVILSDKGGRIFILCYE